MADAPVIRRPASSGVRPAPIQLRAVEHRAQRRACSCGALTTAPFLAEARAPAYYGPGVAALGAYLLGREHLPVERAAETMAD